MVQTMNQTISIYLNSITSMDIYKNDRPSPNSGLQCEIKSKYVLLDTWPVTLGFIMAFISFDFLCVKFGSMYYKTEL